MITTVKKFVLALCVVGLLATPASFVSAGEFTARPFLIDKTMLPRDVETETVLLTNDSPNRKYEIYATVNEITVDKEGVVKEFVTPSMVDRSVTVTSWIEVSRGQIEIPPGEQREVPVTIRVNPKAEPGEYHAFLGFVPAKNRPAAEAIAMAGEADGTVVKITVSDQREDSMRISRFLIDRFVTGERSSDIAVEIENTGDIASAPQGEIIFYNSRGVEVTAVPFNTEERSIAPGETVTLLSAVPADADIGRYKANLSLRYGENQRAALYDTTFFYSVPLYILILVLVGIVLFSGLMAYLFRRAFAEEGFHDEPDEVTMFIRDGHDAEPQDHDIDLKKN